MLRLSRGISTSSRLSAAAAAAAAPAPAAAAPRRLVPSRPALSAARAAAARMPYNKPAPTSAYKAPTSSYTAPASANKAAPTSSYNAAPASAPRPPFRQAPAPARAEYTPRTPVAAKPAPAPSPAQAPAPAPPFAAPAEQYEQLDEFASFEEIEDYAHLRPPANASPPLQSLPGAGYTPLPPAPISQSAPSLPTRTALRARSQTDDIGAPTIADGYVFKMPGEQAVEDWTTSFKGLSERPFDREVADALLRPLETTDIEIKPDGLLYLPEIKYRRTLNAAFGPGGWGMAPRGETHIGPRIVSREWGLVCLGRLVAIARGEQEYFDPSGVPTATEACKSNALMRCCKDLGIASELWDPRFIRDFKSKYCTEAMVEHQVTKKKRKLWRMKTAKFDYPYKEVGWSG